jgi:hypothetical protein
MPGNLRFGFDAVPVGERRVRSQMHEERRKFVAVRRDHNGIETRQRALADPVGYREVPSYQGFSRLRFRFVSDRTT